MAGPTVLAWLRLALVNIWGPAVKKESAQHRDSWWLRTGAWRGSISPTGHGPFPCNLLPQAQWPGTSLLLDAHCLRPAPKPYGMGTFLREPWGHNWQCGAVPRDPSHRVLVSCPLIQVPTAHLLLSLSSARSQGTGLEPSSRVPLPPMLPPQSPTMSSIFLVEYPTVSWESWERGPCLNLIQAHTTPGNLAPCNGVCNPLGLSQGLGSEEGILTVLEHACHCLLPSSQW